MWWEKGQGWWHCHLHSGCFLVQHWLAAFSQRNGMKKQRRKKKLCFQIQPSFVGVFRQLFLFGKQPWAAQVLRKEGSCTELVKTRPLHYCCCPSEHRKNTLMLEKIFSSSFWCCSVDEKAYLGGQPVQKHQISNDKYLGEGLLSFVYLDQHTWLMYWLSPLIYEHLWNYL